MSFVTRNGVEADGACGLHSLQVGGGGCGVYQRGWGQLFWLIRMLHNSRWDLMANDERWDVGTLVLWFVIVCSGGGAIANVQGRVGAVAVGGIKMFAVAIAAFGVAIAVGGSIGVKVAGVETYYCFMSSKQRRRCICGGGN